ncbi:DNA excision repair protein ERCC-6-like [Pituophis catenifer annectens]|uniref:DNA excision repair protein ERCC-6-like n=1 Tax=Pituophis catenifer annectens TaxID=94852 RepID=UPI00399650EC
MAELADLNPEQIEEYRRYVSQAKQEARSGNLEASIQLFQQALEIHSSEKLTANIKKLEEDLASLAVEEEEDDDGIFVDVCQSGLMLNGEMHDKLFDYQREGVAFLYQLYRDRRKGGILADDMGLGKTIQVIAFLSGMFDAKLIRSVLLILPVSLLNNWVKEFAKWTPGLRVKVFHGTNKAERNRSLERIQRRKGILLTTYQMLLNSRPQLSSFGGKEFVWDYIILDEAHKIKTPSAKTTKFVNAISSKNRILLTGTPVQNNLKELWALFDFACQGSLLGTSKTFRMEYENPITRARAKDATPGEKALGLKISENLMSIIKPYFLRRTKDELQKKKKAELPNHLPENQSKDLAPTVPSLPRKNEFIIWAFLSPIQEEIYRNFISLDHIKELLTSKRSPLAQLNILKQLCDHPRLLSNRTCSQLGLEASNYSKQDVVEKNPSELPDMKWSIGHVSDEMLIQQSGKLSFLVALLERLQDEGHRTLVFSLSRKMLDIIERVLTHRGFKVMRVDGTVTQLAEREKRIGMFQKDGDYSVFLLTTQVGGVGLTLTAASRVVIFDPSWNPATDAQAVDRAYRIGQKENVIIYRLITCGTVEEKIYRRQVFKDSLMRQSTGDKKNPYRYFTMQEVKELFILEDTRSSATQLQLQSLHATQRKTDTELDEHIAYLHALDIFGISDHDLMYTRDTAHDDEAENEEAHRYIEHRVQKAQELVQLESQLNDQHMRNIRNTTEGAWLRDIDSSTQPKTKPSKSSPSETLGPSMSERTNPTVVASPIPSMKKSPTPLPTPVFNPPVFISPVHSNEVIDLTSDDDNDVVSDMVNLSSKMTSLVVEDVDDEQILQIISNMEDALPSEEKEQQFPSFQACELKPGTSLVSPFQTHSISNKEDYGPESSAISELLAQDKDDEQLVLHTINTEVLHFKNKGYQPIRLQADEQNESLNLVSPLLQAISLSIEGSVNSESKMIFREPSPEARNELKDVQMKLLQDSIVYPDDDMHQTQADMSLGCLHADACAIKELDAVAPQETMLSKMTESITLRKSDVRETAQFKSLDISSLQMRNTRNTTEGTWVRDIDSSTQPKIKPSRSSSGGPLGPSMSERTNPTVVASPIPSMIKSPTPLPMPVAIPPVFISPVLSNKVIDLTSDDDNDVVSDMVNLSSIMTSLVLEDVDVEQILQIIFNMEDALPSEEKQQQFPSFQACELKPGTGLVSPFQTHPVSNKENYSPESSAISELPAQDKDDEQLVLHTINTEVLHFKNKEYQPIRLQADEQNESLNVVSPLLQVISLSIEGSVNSESKMIFCEPSPEARNELKDVQMKLLQDSIVYPDDDMHQTQADMSLGCLHGDACAIKELDAVEPQETMLSKMTESITLRKSDVRETAQFKSLDISSLQMRNTRNTTEGTWDFAEKDMSLKETVNEGFQLKLVSYCSSATESIGREHGSHRSLQTSNGAEGSVVMDDSNGPCDSRDSFGLWKKKRPAIIVSDEEEENDELIDELDEDKPEGICMSTPKTNRPMAAMYFSPRVKLSGRRSTASRRSLFDLVLEEVEGAAEEAGSKDLQMKLLQDSIVYPDDDMHQTQADMSLDWLYADACEIKELDAVAPQETMLSKMTESITLQKSDVRETAQFKSLDISSQQMRNTRNTTEGTWTHSISNKEDYGPESSAISELPAQDKDDEQLVFHTINTEVLHFKNKEYQPIRLQAEKVEKVEGAAEEAGSKDLQMKLLQDSIVYPDDDMHQTQADMSLDWLHADACEIKELDAVAPQETMLSKMTESITLQKSDVRETAQFKSLDISSHYQHRGNIRNTTEGASLRDIESSTQPKTKPSRSSSGDPLGPSMSERRNPIVVASPIPSMKKSPTPPPTPVVTPPVFISPALSNKVIELVSHDDNDVVSDMVNLSSIMTSLVVKDVDDEQMLQIISNMEDALPSEEKEQQFSSFQECELKPGTGHVSPFQTHSVSRRNTCRVL